MRQRFNVAALICLVGVLAIGGFSWAGQDDLSVLKQRYVDDLLTASVNEDSVRQWMETLETDGHWPDVDYEDASRGAFEHRVHADRLVAMARAWRREGGELSGDEQLASAMRLALDHWLEQDYRAENWWWNEMGIPRQLVRALLMMEEALEPAQLEAGLAIVSRASLEGFGARPGGDLVPIAEIMVQRGALAGDEALVQTAVDAIANELRFADGLRGVHRDYSLHHRRDSVKNTTSYGYSYLNSVANFAAKASGTRFALPPQRLELVIDFYLEGVRWSLAHGTYRTPFSMNRDISRPGAMTRLGRRAVSNLLEASSYREQELRRMLEVHDGQAEPFWSGNRMFFRSEVMSHQRPGYHVGLRMYSSRNHNTEQPYNHEGLKNHHLADGMYSLVRDGTEYRNLPPVWDWQKLPGTTVLQKEALPRGEDIQQPGLRDFVGGVSDGRYGAAAMDFVSPHDGIEARKAWFFFDEGFVALGAGIESDRPEHVATTLNQSRLRGPVRTSGDEGERTLEQGLHELSQARWVHHDRTGYFFFSPASAHLEHGLVEGSWGRINDQPHRRDVEAGEEVFTLWLDHGPAVRGGGYAYAIMPGVEADAMTDLVSELPYHVLANEEAVQAVSCEASNVVGAVFHQAGALEIEDGLELRVDRPSMVLLRMQGDRVVSLAAADPTWSLQRLKVAVAGEEEAEAGASWDVESGRGRVAIDLPEGDRAGDSVVVELAGE